MAAIDTVTDEAMVVLQDRPVVAMSPWLVRALEECGEPRRMLQLVTPATSRLTLPLRQVLSGGLGAWVVRDGDGYYEGLTGRPLHWAGGMFAPMPDARDHAAGFVTRPAMPIEPLPVLLLRVRHAADGTVGGTTERLFQLLTGAAPAGWADSEPVTEPWDRARLTAAVRQRGGRPVRVVAVGGGGRHAIATMEFSGGREITESVTLVLGRSADGARPELELPVLINAFEGRFPMDSLLVQLLPGRADLTFEPRWTGTPAPVGVAVAGARAALPGIPAQQAGPTTAPMTCYTLGDGRSADGWQRYQQLLQHLQTSGG